MKKQVNFFIIGQPKSGTTAIYDYLRHHPELFLPKQKQLYYFASDHNQERNSKKKYKRDYYKKYYNYSFNDYINHFDFSNNHKYYCDITPDYFYSSMAAQNIYNYNPKAKIILLLREPLSFAKSFHNQLINSGCETELDFNKVLSLEKARKNSKQVFNTSCPQQFYYYSELVDYIRFIKPYFEKFQDNFKIIIYEDFKRDNIKFLQYIFEYLEVNLINYNSIIKSNISSIASIRFKHKINDFYPLRILSSFIPITLKRNIKKKLKKEESNLKVKFPENVEKDNIFRNNIKNQILELNTFINENNLLLNRKEINLISFWGYDK